MNLSQREKHDLYHQLGRLLHAGTALPAALRSIAKDRRLRLRRLAAAMERELREGAALGEVLARHPGFSRLESSVLAACERSGRLEQGCHYLAEYFAAMDNARRAVWRKAAYPLFVLHFGVFILAVPRLFTGGTPLEYLRDSVGFLLGLYLVAGVVYGVSKMLAAAARDSAQLDVALGMVPLIGRIRRSFAVARFCGSYDMQLQAGVNVMDALGAAARASQSGRILRAIDGILPEVRLGGQVSPLLAQRATLPAEALDGFRLGEETGQLDRELQRLSEEYKERGLLAMEWVSEWAPRLLYLAVVLWVAFRIVQAYRETVLNPLLKMLDPL